MHLRHHILQTKEGATQRTHCVLQDDKKNICGTASVNDGKCIFYHEILALAPTVRASNYPQLETVQPSLQLLFPLYLVSYPAQTISQLHVHRMHDADHIHSTQKIRRTSKTCKRALANQCEGSTLKGQHHAST